MDKKRELKFRQWMEEHKKFRYWGYINHPETKQEDWYFYGPITNPFIESQQFTGLVDCNGVDIYEGDILGLVYGGHVRGEVSWHEQVGAWSWEHGIEWGMIEPSDVEVIGNIYENPDRLDNGLWPEVFTGHPDRLDK